MIFLFVLIFFGADKIPGLAKNLGKGIRQIKDASQDFQDEVRKTSTEIRREANMNREQLNETKRTLEAPVKKFTKDLEDSGSDINKNIEGSEKSTFKKQVPRDQIQPRDQPIPPKEKTLTSSDTKRDQK